MQEYVQEVPPIEWTWNITHVHVLEKLNGHNQSAKKFLDGIIITSYLTGTGATIEDLCLPKI